MFYALPAYSAVSARKYRKKYERLSRKVSAGLIPFYTKPAAEFWQSELEAKCMLTHTELYL